MIRHIQREDIGEVLNVIRTSFLTVAERFGFTAGSVPRYVSFYISGEKLEKNFRENRPMFAYYDDSSGKIAGYYALKILKEGVCDLKHLCVLPEYRHRRIGAELFRHAVKTAKQGGCKTMRLSVIEEDTEMREWFEGQGAKHIGTQKFDFFPFSFGCLELDLTAAAAKPPKSSGSALNERKGVR